MRDAPYGVRAQPSSAANGPGRPRHGQRCSAAGRLRYGANFREWENLTPGAGKRAGPAGDGRNPLPIFGFFDVGLRGASPENDAKYNIPRNCPCLAGGLHYDPAA